MSIELENPKDCRADLSILPSARIAGAGSGLQVPDFFPWSSQAYPIG